MTKNTNPYYVRFETIGPLVLKISDVLIHTKRKNKGQIALSGVLALLFFQMYTKQDENQDQISLLLLKIEL